MTFEELLKNIQEKIEIESTPWDIYDILEESQISYKAVSEEMLSANRWSITMQEVLKIGDRYLEIVWDAPATENQEGQCTNMEVNEVFPHEKNIIVYTTKREKE